MGQTTLLLGGVGSARSQWANVTRWRLANVSDRCDANPRLPCRPRTALALDVGQGCVDASAGVTGALTSLDQRFEKHAPLVPYAHVVTCVVTGAEGDRYRCKAAGFGAAMRRQETK